jgi:Uncharacterized conserved protein
MFDYTITSNATVPSEGIKCITVGWVSGHVDVVKYDGEDIIFNESANRELNEDQMMRYKIVGNELKIVFSADGKSLPKGIFNNLSKTLTLCIPKELQVLNVDTVSAGIAAEGISTEILKLKTVSGSLNALNLSVSAEIDANTVSGSIYVDNITAFREINTHSVSGSIKLNDIKAFHNVKCNTVSGSINVQCMDCPQGLHASTVSGRIEVSLPENDGFSAKYSSVSGKMTCGFPCMIEKNHLIYKDGGAEMRFNTVSGGISINRT